MLRVRVSDQARADLNAIWDYIADDSLPAADRMIQRLVDTYREFAHTPHMGRSREELRPCLRSYPVGNYLVFYRVETDRIDILRILHGARDLEALFEREREETFTDL